MTTPVDEGVVILDKKTAIAIICPFCLPAKRMVYAGFDVNTGDGVALHEEPSCSQFDDNDVDVYLKLSRLRMSE